MRVPQIDEEALKTIGDCEFYVQWLFERISERHGEDRATRIFAPYGGLTKRDKKLREDTALLVRLLMMKPKPNVRQLATELAKERGIERDTIERKIWRVVRDERARGRAALTVAEF